MISIKDLYTVLSAMVPLYVAMFLAYGSVRWWKIFTPVQCSGINRLVAVFAVPLLSFHFISTNNPYKMDGLFILADTISKLAILMVLAAWTKFSHNGSLDWMITLFALATLPNTLVMGIPLLTAMYGSFYGGLMVQLVVLQCIVWYTLMLFLFEYRAARLLVMEQFPETAASIISFKVDSDVLSLDGKEPLETQADVGEDGKIRVSIRKSNFNHMEALASITCPRGIPSMPSSKAITPRPSNMTGAEIYSVYSSRNNTPREVSHNRDFNLSAARTLSPRHSNVTASDVFSMHSSMGPTPRASNVNDDNHREESLALRSANPPCQHNHSSVTKNPASNCILSSNEPGAAGKRVACHMTNTSWPGYPVGLGGGKQSPKALQISKKIPDLGASVRFEDDGKELHMFVWSSTTSPVSEAGVNALGRAGFGVMNDSNITTPESKDVKVQLLACKNHTPNGDSCGHLSNRVLPASSGGEEFSFDSRPMVAGPPDSPTDRQRLGISKSSTGQCSPKKHGSGKPKMPPNRVMIKLILQMVGRKLLRNPNTYSSLLGLVWSLIAFRWDVAMPKIILNSIKLLSDAGLGMAMFSLGLFMALQPKLIACGTSLAIFAMAVRFLTGPAVMAAASIAVGLKGVDLHAAIVQAALPQGIVPFVFAREYDLHPDILSTAVIFGMLVALPTTLIYYILLGL